MRLRSLIVLGTAALLLVSGCAAEPTPKPTRTPSASPSASPTPTPEPIVAPEAAFDLTCDDVATEMAVLLGEPSTPVEPVMSVISSMSWLPGPAQHMFQRAGGIACSAGAGEEYWEVTIVPGAQAVIDGATERQGWSGERADCGEGSCYFELPDADVLLSASIRDSALSADDTARIDEALRRLAATAAATVHDIEYIDSDLAGARCERFVTPQEVAEITNAETVLIQEFGGWGIPAEVYHVVDGARLCSYSSSQDPYSAETFVMITFLPAGAWAYDPLAGEAVEVEGADEAITGTDQQGRPVLDLRIGADWVRLTTYEDARAQALHPLAEKVVRNLTIGHTAPE